MLDILVPTPDEVAEAFETAQNLPESISMLSNVYSLAKNAEYSKLISARLLNSIAHRISQTKIKAHGNLKNDDALKLILTSSWIFSLDSKRPNPRAEKSALSLIANSIPWDAKILDGQGQAEAILLYFSRVFLTAIKKDRDNAVPSMVDAFLEGISESRDCSDSDSFNPLCYTADLAPEIISDDHLDRLRGFSKLGKVDRNFPERVSCAVKYVVDAQQHPKDPVHRTKRMLRRLTAG
jgi:hypothetical protein